MFALRITLYRRLSHEQGIGCTQRYADGEQYANNQLTKRTKRSLT